MEFVARAEGRIQDSIFLQVHPDVLQWEGVRFTSDVSNKSGVDRYSSKKRGEDRIRSAIPNDWKIRDQGQTEQAEKCEILVRLHSLS